jgi:hypothetical protein
MNVSYEKKNKKKKKKKKNVWHSVFSLCYEIARFYFRLRAALFMFMSLGRSRRGRCRNAAAPLSKVVERH